jgi:integrase
VIPLRGRIVLELEHYMLEPLPCRDRAPEPDDYLLYPEKRTKGGRILAAYPKRRMSDPTVDRWWYRHLQAAGLVGRGITSGMNMHRARHTFATDLRRVADLGAASQALGHSDLSTTAAIYGHYDLSDLAQAMEALGKARRAEEEEPAE